ncbi:hypothetical protein ADK38_32190, partial [Streptomyces varsoviensis]
MVTWSPRTSSALSAVPTARTSVSVTYGTGTGGSTRVENATGSRPKTRPVSHSARSRTVPRIVNRRA